MSRSLVVKVTCGADDPERCNQAFTVAAAAAVSGVPVSLWLTGEAAWLAVPGRAAELELPLATPLPDLVDDPGPAEVVDERTAVLLEDDLLPELEALDRRVVAVAVALPATQHPRERRAQLVDVLGDLERHGPHSSVGTWHADSS